MKSSCTAIIRRHIVSVYHSRTKHIDVKQHFIWEALDSQEKCVTYIPTEKYIFCVLLIVFVNVLSCLRYFQSEYFKNIIFIQRKCSGHSLTSS